MTGEYLIVFKAWPFSTGKGADEDLRVAGPEQREFKIVAHSLKEAQAAALNIRRGILSSGHVWQAPLQSISWLGSAAGRTHRASLNASDDNAAYASERIAEANALAAQGDAAPEAG